MERRAYSRQRTLKTGKIIFNQRSSVVDCTVRNLSTKGALLQIVSTLGIPNDFDLVIEPDKAAVACRVAWKNDRQMGVTFSDGAERGARPNDSAGPKGERRPHRSGKAVR